jgi:glyoxylase-like metal-dependent hydrolase (beta-lactamase superfamily II)
MALAFNRDFEPRHGQAVEVAPGIRRVTAPNEGPFTFRGTNTYLIGTDRLAVLDPGPDDAGHLEAVSRAIGEAEVVAILVTHTHRDHSPAARLLKAQHPAPILGAGAHRPSRPPRTGEELRLDASADHDHVPDTALGDGAIVPVGEMRLDVVATPGHTANHLAFALKDRNIIFSGDHVMGWSTTIVAPPDGSMADYMASLDRLLARPERVFLPGHGGQIDDGHLYVRALKAHRTMREAAILDGLRRGDRTIPQLVARVYGGIDPRLRGAAALSTLAHLEDFATRGLVRTGSAPSLDASYEPAEPGALAGSG